MEGRFQRPVVDGWALAMAAAATGSGIAMLSWLAFERGSRPASLTNVIVTGLGSIAMILWLVPLTSSWESWQSALQFAAFAALLPLTTAVAAYGHWRWAKLLGQSVRIAGAGKEQASQN